MHGSQELQLQQDQRALYVGMAGHFLPSPAVQQLRFLLLQPIAGCQPSSCSAHALQQLPVCPRHERPCGSNALHSTSCAQRKYRFLMAAHTDGTAAGSQLSAHVLQQLNPKP